MRATRSHGSPLGMVRHGGTGKKTKGGEHAKDDESVSRCIAVAATFWTKLPKVSRPAPEAAPMSSVVFFHARFGMEDEFNSLIGEFHMAIEKTQMPWKYQWFALASGGEGGSYALVLPRANFASFNPSGKPFNEMLEEAYGKTAANALLDRWHKVVERTENHLIQGRPELSYTAAP